MSEIKPFLCDNIEKSLLRNEWEKWLRAFDLYLAAEEISDVVKKKNKLLHLGGAQLQEVVFNIPGALIDYEKDTNNDVYKILVDKLNEYFSPKRNSTFERHVLRELKPLDCEDFNKFLLRLRNQTSKCTFGSTEKESKEISLKDKIIDSWAPNELKAKLLEKEQSLDDIIQACVVFEQINKQTKSMSSKSDQDTVNKISTAKRWTNTSEDECGRCGQRGHTSESPNCPAKRAKCKKCSLVGHFARKCKTKSQYRRSDERQQSGFKRRRPESSRVRCITEEENDDITECSDNKIRKFDCFKIEDNSSMDESITCNIGGQNIAMIIDSGSQFNLLSEIDWTKLKNNKSSLWNIRTESSNQFKAYAADQLLKVLYVFDAPISVRKNSEMIAPFFVIKNGNQSLLGRDTAIKLGVLKLGLEVNKIEAINPFPKIKNLRVKLAIDNTVKPIQQPMRRIPVALEQKLEDKLKEALAQDIIEPVVGPSSWISPIVIVFKRDGGMRLCIDMRCANKAILRENFPLPTFESFMTKLKGARFFSRLDLKNAYHQLELDESSRSITTFITPKGLFRYKRLLFGVNSAPEIFQRTLEGLLSSCSNCLNYIDDVIIYGKSEDEHDMAVKKVLETFKLNNVTLNADKCTWKAKKLHFLGHILSDSGILPDQEKIQTINNFRPPETKEELRSFLGNNNNSLFR